MPPTHLPFCNPQFISHFTYAQSQESCMIYLSLLFLPKCIGSWVLCFKSINGFHMDTVLLLPDSLSGRRSLSSSWRHRKSYQWYLPPGTSLHRRLQFLSRGSLQATIGWYGSIKAQPLCLNVGQLTSHASVTSPCGESGGKHVRQLHCSSIPPWSQSCFPHCKCCALKHSAVNFLPTKLHFRVCYPRNLTCDTIGLRIKSQNPVVQSWLIWLSSL